MKHDTATKTCATDTVTTKAPFSVKTNVRAGITGTIGGRTPDAPTPKPWPGMCDPSCIRPGA